MRKILKYYIDIGKNKSELVMSLKNKFTIFKEIKNTGYFVFYRILIL
ncbi:hypothetical protein HMPREF1983_01069 [Gemella bergeri ATCC 700627]|uniref:Uncharacterized protein n=1 Tax=Gemella bergeri ATCC 700627 TaxID=1321820 RepID=U2Q4C9_9BACL|nr:hypothetical protein HMPREF1983_01069 [Gemella bergeri ATCC 700627]